MVASEPDTPKAAPLPQEDKGQATRAVKRKRKRLVIALVVVAVALVVIFWGWSSTGGDFLDVSSVVEESQVYGGVPQKYVGERVEIRGIIADWNGSASDLNFKLYDDGEGTAFINVSFTGVYPEGFNNSKPAVVKGQFEGNLPLKLLATDISIGCSSKY